MKQVLERNCQRDEFASEKQDKFKGAAVTYYG